MTHPVDLLQKQLGTVLSEVLWQDGLPLALWCRAQLGAEEEPLLGLRRQNQPEARRPGGTHQNPLETLVTVELYFYRSPLQCKSLCPGDSLPRVGPLQVVRVDVNVWNELVDDTAGRVYDPVGHLWGDPRRVSERVESRSCSLTACSVAVTGSRHAPNTSLSHDLT